MRFWLRSVDGQPEGEGQGTLNLSMQARHGSFVYIACTRGWTLRAPIVRHKHLKLDQRKIDFAKRYFGVASEQEAIDRALSLLMEEQQILAALKPLKGALKDDRRPWPYL